MIQLLRSSLFASLAIAAPLFSEDQCFPQMEGAKSTWTGRIRERALHRLDQVLNWSISQDRRTYILEKPFEEKLFDIDSPMLWNFAHQYNYFSPAVPLIARVSHHKGDKEIVFCLFKQLAQKIKQKEFLELATAEILTKVLAYRNLDHGDEVVIPTLINTEIHTISYIVDEVFNLWNGMPAFGLIPKEEAPAILLFRGTDFTLDSKAAWASLMSDLDISGPGLSTFHKGQQEIHDWLVKVDELDKKAKVIGYSLGGVLAAYTFIYENDLVTAKGSIGFNAPGVSDKVLKDWAALPQERKNGFIFYVNQGDMVSKFGKLFAKGYALSLASPMKPIHAHTILLCGQNSFFLSPINITAENTLR